MVKGHWYANHTELCSQSSTSSRKYKVFFAESIKRKKETENKSP